MSTSIIEIPFPLGPQTFHEMLNCIFEDGIQYRTIHIPNLLREGHLQILNCVESIFYLTPEKKIKDRFGDLKEQMVFNMALST